LTGINKGATQAPVKRIARDALLKKAFYVLDLPEDSSADNVKGRYTALVHAQARGEINWERMKEIGWAYEILVQHLLSEPDGSQPANTQKTPSQPAEKEDDPSHFLKSLLFPTEEKINPFYFGGRILLLGITVFWGLRFIFAPVQGDYIGGSFMHLINLPFHEAGHMIFSFLGDFMRVLGGTLMQILVPAICMAAFLKRGDAFSASFALWWVGQSFIDTAPYIYDARAGELMLLGGITGQEAPDYHDWHIMVERLGLLAYDHAIAYLSKYTGVLFMLLSFGWGVCILIRQYRNLDRT